MRPPPALPLIALPLAACTFAAMQIDPPLGQLARWREATPAAIAAEPVVTPCPASNEACPQLHARRAEACMGLAMAARAPGAACPGPAEAAHLGCAAEGYATALALASGATPDAAARAKLAASGAQALLCHAELLAGPEALTAAAKASSLAAQAEPARAATLGAEAALLRARLSPPDQRCDAAREAARLAGAAPPEQRDRLSADAALVPGCTP